ncbi:CD209 antigen-like protein A [Arvicanthis niloticus]|uniref:CD209 antigen-like protein A n=1 Tax=Arvicanthis niloticus TaxID=61156 RepID=UPI001485DC16|nr:CD209 antigen-like protein A [Arvicanthis niloticus]
MLQLISIVLLAGLLMAILVKGSGVSKYQEHDLEKQHILQKLDQLKAGLDHLCRHCPWDWTLFQGNCYLFSTFQKNWKESVTARKNMGAQLVVIKSNEGQEPNNDYGNEDCAVISNDGWNDISCLAMSFWICKKPVSPCST